MLFAPLRWARLPGWSIPADTDLAVYFGRCLGTVLCVIGAVVLLTLDDPAAMCAMHRFALDAATLMVVLHVVGVLADTQPPAETREMGCGPASWWCCCCASRGADHPVHSSILTRQSSLGSPSAGHAGACRGWVRPGFTP